VELYIAGDADPLHTKLNDNKVQLFQKSQIANLKTAEGEANLRLDHLILRDS